jgi:hypothetical protein
MQETNRVEFATARLAADVALHYAERGDREGEAVIFSFSRVLPLLSAELRPVVRLPNTRRGATA